MKALVLLSTMGMATIVVVISIMTMAHNQKTKFELVQCQIQSLKYRNEVADLKAEREYVKEKIGAFYPKIVWKEKK